jgi:hypothetical protein
VVVIGPDRGFVRICAQQVRGMEQPAGLAAPNERLGMRRGRPARPTGCGELLGIAPDGGPRAVEGR